MQIAVTYENGVLVPQTPLKLRQKKLWVNIPDAMLRQSQTESEEAIRTPMRERINRILGEHAKPRSTESTESDRSLWQQHLLEKYQ